MYEQIDILDIDRKIKTTLRSENSETTDTQKFNMDNLQISESLRQKIDNWIEKNNVYNQKRSHEFYLLDTVELVEDYKTSLQTPIKISFLNSTVTDTSNKSMIINEYLNRVKDYDMISYPYLKTDLNSSPIIYSQKCSRCNSTIITESIEYVGLVICLDCGLQETTFNLANSIRLNHNDSKRVNICPKYSYDKKSHFLNCINQYQGKHKSGIKPEIINMIKKELEKYDLVDHSKKTKRAKYRNVSKEHIFIFVKELKLTKCYGDVNLIHHLITGTELNNISHLTEKLLQDFDQFVQIHHKKFPNDSTERKNFNYQHLLYQLLLRHKYPCNPSEFNFLKTIDRKYYHDEVCRVIFEHLGWNYSSFF